MNIHVLNLLTEKRWHLSGGRQSVQWASLRPAPLPWPGVRGHKLEEETSGCVRLELEGAGFLEAGRGSLPLKRKGMVSPGPV